MGQKVHPYGFRVGITRPWKSRWFARGKNIAKHIGQDAKIRKLIDKDLKAAGVAQVDIERAGEETTVWIHTARPGIIIGHKGGDIDTLKVSLEKLTDGSPVNVNIKEIAKPELNAQLVAMSIADQLAKRASFRRAMKKSIEACMNAGAMGVKIQCAGRLGGAEIARVEKYSEGSIPLQTLDADIDYGFAEGLTTYGQIGVKVWLFKGDIRENLEAEKKAAQRQRARRR